MGRFPRGDGAGRSETPRSADLGYPKNDYPHRVASVTDTSGATRPTWQIPALAAAISSVLGTAALLFFRRRSSQKRLRIEVPIPAWPAQAGRAREVAYQAIDSGREHTASMLESAAHHVQSDNRTGGGLQGVAGKTAACGMQEAAGYLRGHEAAEVWGGFTGYVKHYPGRTALMAVAVGIVVGRILR